MIVHEMKKSHMSTPRTLSQCSFDVGYCTAASARAARRGRAFLELLLAVVVVTAIGLLAALG